MRILSAILAGATFISAAALAASPQIGRAAFGLPGAPKPQKIFAPDASQIELHLECIDMPKGTQLAAKWIAVATKAAPPNYLIDTAAMTVDHDIVNDEMGFNLSKPNNGWPLGSYKVEVFINGALAKSATFTVRIQEDAEGDSDAE